MSKDSAVLEFIREQVPDWDDEVMATARFKAFSGQRSDWEPRFRFWRDLIINIARHFRFLFLSPSQMNNSWFNRGGLVPLCLNDVLVEMYKSGDILRVSDLGDPRIGRSSWILQKVMSFSGVFRSSNSIDIILKDDRLILSKILEDKADEVIKTLSESHWTSSCLVTMRKFENLVGDRDEVYAVLSYLSGKGKAKYLSIQKKEEQIEGVKVSLSSNVVAASIPSHLDYDILQLVHTTEELQQQLDVIEKRYESLRKSALAALKSGNRNGALRNARELKIASQSREKLSSFLNRVEGVLHVIADSESTKKVTEAIQIGARAMKENRIDVEEVQLCLQEVGEFVGSQEQVHKALDSAATYDGVEDEDFEEELKELESQISDENLMVSAPKSEEDGVVAGSLNKSSVTADLLSEAMSGLKLEDAPKESRIQSSATASAGNHKGLELETA